MSIHRTMRAALLCLAGLTMQPALLATQPPQVRGVVHLARSTVDGQRVAELSGLAWDARSQVLYAVSDRGHLFRFRLERNTEGLLRSVVPISSHTLLDRQPVAGANPAIDAEGLTLWYPPGKDHGLPQLLVSTEGLPRVLRVDTGARVQGMMALPAALGNAEHGQAGNRLLEAVTHSPRHGLLVAAESAVNDQEQPLHTVHGHRRSWSFTAHGGGPSRLKAMDVIDGEQLVLLERARVGKGKSKGLVNVLRLIDLNRCEPQEVCPAQDLLLLTPTDGSQNFEGMTWLGGRQFLLVSDSPGSPKAPSIFMLVDLPVPQRE